VVALSLAKRAAHDDEFGTLAAWFLRDGRIGLRELKNLVIIGNNHSR
jgi:hypothetical protein